MLVCIDIDGKRETCALEDGDATVRWLRDARGHRLGRLQYLDDSWRLLSEPGYVVQAADATAGPSLELSTSEDAQLVLRNLADDVVARVVSGPAAGFGPSCVVGIAHDGAVTVGADSDCELVYRCAGMAPVQAYLRMDKGSFTVECTAGIPVYLDDTPVKPGSCVNADCGSVVSIGLIRIVIGHHLIAVSGPAAGFRVAEGPWRIDYHAPANTSTHRRSMQAQNDSFFPAPRFPRAIADATLSVDAPPAPEKPDDTPIIMKIGPSMVMAFAAVFSGVAMFSTVMESGGSWLRAAPMLAMAVSMIAGCVLWPIISKRMQNKKAARAEEARRSQYAQYLDAARRQLADIAAEQADALRANRTGLGELLERLGAHDTRLMDRIPAHNDFMCLRVGTGSVPLAADVRWPETRFEVERDDLAQMVASIAAEPRRINDVPLALDLVEHRTCGIVCAAPDKLDAFARGLVAQAALLHSPEDVRICIICSAERGDAWRWAKTLPHAMDGSTRLRLAATGTDEAAALALELEHIAAERSDMKNATREDLVPRYLVVCDGPDLASQPPFEGLSRLREDAGFSLVALASDASVLPKRCSTVVEIDAGGTHATMRSRGQVRPDEFRPDILLSAHAARDVAIEINRIPLPRSENDAIRLPESLTFMDMMEAGSTEQLGIAARWAASDPASSLAADIGAAEGGRTFKLDLHEAAHGPHALVAGTTGSGKSEFIISWILSMCATFSPDECAFVLIDYKGGGLAGAFDDPMRRLPHLAGTITNLDGAAVTRSMVSIQSELKRRQALFNQARTAANGDNVDISRYLRLYREGAVTEPCPHLFIVADEFAELKSQQPEFLDELVSAARIGRSLGVHLILATQKPSGVVSDQIWSNARTKVCLKVADAADSKDMVRTDDAARITQAGRFWMLVGYGDMYASGQAAWAGAEYAPTERYEPPVDDSVELVGLLGRTVEAVAPSHRGMSAGRSQQVALLDAIREVAAQRDLQARRLWLDPLPEHITVDHITERFAEQLSKRDPWELDPVVGILDDPANQAQRALTLPLSREGNAVVYGSAGSGKEMLLCAAIYSLMGGYESKDLALYVVDFGSGILSAFHEAPQLGGFCGVDDEERVLRLLDLIEKEMSQRTSLLSSFGGDFVRYKTEGGDKPAILLVINELAAFCEIMGNECEQRLTSILRAANRCGIYLMVTASAAADVRMRMRQGFALSVCMNLNDDNDYSAVLGSLRGVVSPTSYGHGLVSERGELFAFLCAHIAPDNQDDVAMIKDECKSNASRALSCAESIPIMPEHITVAALQWEGSVGSIPVGIECESLGRSTIDMENTLMTRISSRVLSEVSAMHIAAVIELLSQGRQHTTVIDVTESLGPLPKTVSLISDRQQAESRIEELSSHRVSSQTKDVEEICIIYDAFPLMGIATSTNAWSALAGQTIHDGVRWIIVTAGREARDYLTRIPFSAFLSRDEGIWIGDGLKGCTSYFDVGFMTGRTLKATEHEGFVLQGGDPVRTRFVETEELPEEKEG